MYSIMLENSFHKQILTIFELNAGSQLAKNQ